MQNLGISLNWEVIKAHENCEKSQQIGKWLYDRMFMKGKLAFEGQLVVGD